MADTKHEKRRAITVTAVITFVITLVGTTIGQYFIEGVVDGVWDTLTTDIAWEGTEAIGLPFSVVVPTDPDGTLDSLDLPFSAEALALWAENRGGAPADMLEIPLTIWGSTDRPVLITGVRATEVRCSPAPAWAWIQSYGGGEVNERAARITLDSVEPNAIGLEDAATGEIFKFPLQVSRSELELIRIFAVADHSDCTFRLEIGSWESGEAIWHDAGSSYRVISPSNAVAQYRPSPSPDDRLSLDPVDN